MKKITKIIIAILLIIVIAVIGGVLFYKTGIQAVSNKSKNVVVEVKKGTNASTVLNELDAKGLLKNKMAAKLYVRLEKPELKSNAYRLNTNMDVKKIFKILSTGDKKYIANGLLTITEGETIPQIATKVAKLLKTDQTTVLNQWKDINYLKTLSNKYWFINEADITNPSLLYPLEGYLYPETYYINASKPTLDEITTKMLDTMDQHLTVYKDQISKSGFTMHQFLTLSSIVEKETLYEKDISPIAGVFINRLNKNMPLGSDITINYALGRTGVKVTSDMLKTPSPYNTYLNKGLPVGPVASVQDKTIKGVLNYTKSDYLYFFAKKDGTVVYSKTYQEHQEAIKKYKWY